jgi:NAD(P)-dependent dehydrogenase (short-subunit alcohol dehydrogenase family)
MTSGGNQGIGFEIVKAIAALPNHQVLLGCRDTHAGEVAASSMGAPANVNPIQLDITDDDSVEHAFLAIQQIFGKLDILINNAGELLLLLPRIVREAKLDSDCFIGRNGWPRRTF